MNIWIQKIGAISKEKVDEYLEDLRNNGPAPCIEIQDGFESTNCDYVTTSKRMADEHECDDCKGNPKFNNVPVQEFFNGTKSRKVYVSRYEPVASNRSKEETQLLERIAQSANADWIRDALYHFPLHL